MSWIREKLEEFKEAPFIITRSGQTTYGDALARVEEWRRKFAAMKVKQGDCVAIIDDNTEATIILVLALLTNKSIVLLPMEHSERTEKIFSIAQVNGYFSKPADDFQYSARETPGTHPLLEQLRVSEEAGLIILTSGSTGDPKAAVHQFSRMIAHNTAKKTRKSFRTLVFLKLDHIGGINTLLAIMAGGGSIVMVRERSPQEICEAIETHRVELLPTTPSFLNMLIMSKTYEKYDLSSLKMVTYGTEPMHKSTLNALNGIFPEVAIKQTYGATELGIFPTKSKDSSSRWMKIGGEGVETRIVDGTLHIKTRSMMLGYLNADAAVVDDGWYNTNDKVIVDGEYLKILGRQEEIINVGGEKVYPAEIESMLLEMPNVKDVAVRGMRNPVTGEIVGATFVLEKEEEHRQFNKRVQAFCRDRLDPYKIPRVITITDKSLIGSRFKKKRL